MYRWAGCCGCCCCCCGSLDDMNESREDCVSSEENRLRNVPLPPPALPLLPPPPPLLLPPFLSWLVLSAADSVLFVMADVVDVVEDM